MPRFLERDVNPRKSSPTPLCWCSAQTRAQHRQLALAEASDSDGDEHVPERGSGLAQADAVPVPEACAHLERGKLILSKMPKCMTTAGKLTPVPEGCGLGLSQEEAPMNCHDQPWL